MNSQEHTMNLQEYANRYIRQQQGLATMGLPPSLLGGMFGGAGTTTTTSNIPSALTYKLTPPEPQSKDDRTHAAWLDRRVNEMCALGRG